MTKENIERNLGIHYYFNLWEVFSPKGTRIALVSTQAKAKELINIHIDKENWVNYEENAGNLNAVEYLRMFINLGHHKRVLSKLGKQLQEEEIKEGEIKKND